MVWFAEQGADFGASKRHTGQIHQLQQVLLSERQSDLELAQDIVVVQRTLQRWWPAFTFTRAAFFSDESVEKGGELNVAARFIRRVVVLLQQVTDEFTIDGEPPVFKKVDDRLVIQFKG